MHMLRNTAQPSGLSGGDHANVVAKSWGRLVDTNLSGVSGQGGGRDIFTSTHLHKHPRAAAFDVSRPGEKVEFLAKPSLVECGRLERVF
jgi:hypothetical protein